MLNTKIILDLIKFSQGKVSLSQPAITASVAGGGKVSLLYCLNMTKLISRIKEWESLLEKEGLDVEFFIGAGDLRRALLHQDIDGPGDLEIFVHFHNHRFSPLNLALVYTLLNKHGINIEQEVGKIFGEKKVLDFFVKDQRSLEFDKPYKGELGYFEGMGDNSINCVFHSVRRDVIVGQYLKELSQGKIILTEPEKASRLSRAEKVKGIGGALSDEEIVAFSEEYGVDLDLREVLIRSGFIDEKGIINSPKIGRLKSFEAMKLDCYSEEQKEQILELLLEAKDAKSEIDLDKAATISPSLVDELLADKLIKDSHKTNNAKAAIKNKSISNIQLNRLSSEQMEGLYNLLSSEREVKSSYKYTILRIALRCIRLNMDLVVSPNKNNFKISGKKFFNALRGFELFFAKCNDAEIAQFKLDEAYIKQFWKIFKNRSPEELATIKQTLNEEFPETVRTWKLLGLDMEIIQPGQEFKAVMGNTSFDTIRPFIDVQTAVVENPFANAAMLDRIISGITVKGTPQEQVKAVPLEILRVRSPKLAYMVENFDVLTPFEKVRAVEKYVEAVKYFSTNAYKQVHVNKKFMKKDYYSFDFLDIRELHVNDKRTLLEFIMDQRAIRPAGSYAVKYQPTNLKMVKGIVDGIKKVKRDGVLPVVVLDLDDTVFYFNSRIFQILKKYDEVYKTDYFSSLKITEVSPSDYEEYLYQYFNENFPEERNVHEIISHINDFMTDQKFLSELMEKDRANTMMIRAIRLWKKAGAKIVYLSARMESSQRASINALLNPANESLTDKTGLDNESLNLYNPGVDEVILVPFKTDPVTGKTKSVNTPYFKADVMRKFGNNNKARLVAFVDDNTDNTSRIIALQDIEKNTKEAIYNAGKLFVAIELMDSEMDLKSVSAYLKAAIDTIGDEIKHAAQIIEDSEEDTDGYQALIDKYNKNLVVLDATVKKIKALEKVLKGNSLSTAKERAVVQGRLTTIMQMFEKVVDSFERDDMFYPQFEVVRIQRAAGKSHFLDRDQRIVPRRYE